MGHIGLDGTSTFTVFDEIASVIYGCIQGRDTDQAIARILEMLKQKSLGRHGQVCTLNSDQSTRGVESHVLKENGFVIYGCVLSFPNRRPRGFMIRRGATNDLTHRRID